MFYFVPFYSPNFIGMNLVLDFGNTRIKSGLFDGRQLRLAQSHNSVEELRSSGCLEAGFGAAIIASVTQNHHQIAEELKSKGQTFVFGPHTPIPIKNLYKSPQTLGSDRLLAAVGSFSEHPGNNVLTIDVGTCIKYNFVNRENEFLGGAISPGIPMRLKAMHSFTSALPLLEVDESFNVLLGTDTWSSLLSGAQLGAAFEVDEAISRYTQRFPDLKTVLTGGDSHYLSGQLKNPFFANPNSLLLGLNTVLLFNLEN